MSDSSQYTRKFIIQHVYKSVRSREDGKKAVAYYCYLNMGATFKECAQIAEISEKEFIRYVIDNKDKNYVTLEQGWEAFERIREQAAELPEITLDEINAEIDAVRRNMEAE